MTDPLERYLRDLWSLRSSGLAVPETSFYPALSRLIDDIGRTLSPKVRCIVHPRSIGAGIPDIGLYTADQLRQTPEGASSTDLVPARGVVEAKGTSAKVEEVTGESQVIRYLDRYGQVLVTNLRDFTLVERGQDGKSIVGESFRLADSEAEFWASAVDPGAVAERLGEQFEQYLKRALMLRARLAFPEDVAFFLASYARDAKVRMEHQDLPGLTAVRTALEEALGLRFEGEKGNHFFRSTFVQTLFYGVFSAWVLWSKRVGPADKEDFDWRTAMWTLRVPAIRVLFEQLALPTRLEPLGLDHVLDQAGAVLNRVDRAAFFARFEEDHAVQYFYEPFLKEFDPELRKDLGVWYTPPEVVEYMVARVDTVLREQLGVADGLADSRVYVLDPCTGTGSYLVEVLKRIAATMKANGEEALLGVDLRRAATERIFGFEILPAPFVVAHLQLGLLLSNFGAALSEERGERVGVYLTNALTGWEPTNEPKMRVLFPELEAERDAAEHVKRDQPILVVLGNPPYNGFAGVAVAEERDLSDAYRTTRKTRQPQGKGLNDLYVRFFRIAERRIVDMSGEGIVCFISNYSWLDGLSFTAMRERYLEVFDGIWLDSLNGDKYKTGKLTPDGKPDPSIFSTVQNPEGIQVGTAVTLMVRKKDHRPVESVQFRHLWGMNKRATLRTDSLHDSKNSSYVSVLPPNDLGLPLMPTASEQEYMSWPLVSELFPVSFPGIQTSRDDVVVDIDRDRLLTRMKHYFDPMVGHEEMHRIAPGAMADTARFNPKVVRDQLRQRGFLPDRVVRYNYRPFDVRWLYWEPESKLLDEKRADYFPHVSNTNAFLFTTARTRKSIIEPPLFTRNVADLNFMDSGARGFPLYLLPTKPQLTFGAASLASKPNLSRSALDFLRFLDLDEQELFYHCLSILHAPAYRHENMGALRHDWPRVPLPAARELLVASASLGRQVAALLDTEVPVPGVTSRPFRSGLRLVARPARIGGGTLNPNEGDFGVTAGWGHQVATGAVMPGRGKLNRRDYTPEEQASIQSAVNPLGLSVTSEVAPLGEETYDIYLNDRVYWANVPSRIWGYTMGGYAVLKKWLSYREVSLLGRPLTREEISEFSVIARRIGALLLIESRLDANYRGTMTMAYPWRVANGQSSGVLPLW